MTLHVILALIGYFLFSAAADSMLPPPPGKEGTFYGFLYRFVQRVAANATRLAEAQLAGKLAGLKAEEERNTNHGRASGGGTTR